MSDFFDPTGDAAGRRSPPPAKSLADRLAYLSLATDDVARLQSLRPIFERFSAELVEAFYRHLFSFADSAHFLEDPAVVSRLKRSQQVHFMSLLEAQWNEAYVAQRNRVGEAHAHIGIDPELFLGAYNQFVQLAVRRYLTSDGRVPTPEVEATLSLFKAVFLDLGLTLEAYFSRATQTLRQALDMYWKANIELRQFAHLTSHDLKTPLATVANFCDEALDEFGDQMPAEARRLIESAKQRTFRMSTMIDELLSTAVSFEPDEQIQQTSSAASISEALDRLRPLITKKEIDVVVPADLPTVWADPVLLRESFYNLLSNAVKFVPVGRGKIEITLQIEPDSYVFAVCDNGPGIPREDRDLIFAPFRRSSLHRGKNGSEGGSGLGLYFTKSMIERQGGAVWADSQLGAGSRFYIRLRRRPESATA
jgi:signal transduction histidine kinase